MDFSVFHNVVTYIHNNPHIGGVITFLVAFTESLAIIGAVIPGSVTMTAIGVLIGSGAMPFTSTFIYAVAGAFCGDFLSYWVGTHFNDRLVLMWPFRKYPHWLDKGKSFFKKHGGKSVVIGRFVGPVRSAVPLIAGLMHMSRLRFLIAALPSAALWSFVYMAPGIIVGMMSLALPAAAATRFILIVLAIVAFSWIFFILVHVFFKTIARLIDVGCAKLWNVLKSQPFTRPLTSLLSRPDHPNPHRQLLLLLTALLFLILFIIVFISEIHHVGLARLNQPLYELFRSIRVKHLDAVMLAFTMLGYKFVLLPAAAVIFVWLVWRRYLWAALHWGAIMLFNVASVEILKTLYFSPRPGGLLNGQVSSSFPSGHTILAVTLLGFLAFLIAELLPAARRKIPYLLSSLVIILVACSRLYLGAHWFTDVLASLFLGIAVLCLVILSFRRRLSRTIAATSFILVSTATILLFWAGYGIAQFRQYQADYTLYWPKVSLSNETWWQHQTRDAPYFVASRLGKPLKVINVQWLGQLQEIKQQMLNNGWQQQAFRMNLKSTLNRLSVKTNPHHLPVFPTLFQNRVPVLLFTKLDRENRPLHFMLWPSTVTITNDSGALWLGSVYYYLPRIEALRLSPQQQQQQYDLALEQLIPALKSYQWKYVQVSPTEQPTVMNPLNWDGRILLIKPGK